MTIEPLWSQPYFCSYVKSVDQLTNLHVTSSQPIWIVIKLSTHKYCRIIEILTRMWHYSEVVLLLHSGINSLVTFIIVTMAFHNAQYIMGYNIIALPHGLTMSL